MPLFSFGVIADVQYGDDVDGANFTRTRIRYVTGRRPFALYFLTVQTLQTCLGRVGEGCEGVGDQEAKHFVCGPTG